MEGYGHQDRDRAVKGALRASRPVPDPRFVHDLERSLFAKRKLGRDVVLRPPLLAGGAAAVMLAAIAFAFGLVGGGPLAPNGGDDVKAGDDCRYVRVKQPVRTPVVVHDAEGKPQIRYRRQMVKRNVKRCG